MDCSWKLSSAPLLTATPVERFPGGIACRVAVGVDQVSRLFETDPGVGQPRTGVPLEAAPLAAKQRLKSPLEAMVLPLIAKRGLPAPRCNAPVGLVEGRIEVDFLWPEQRFVLEADSRDFHATDIAFERDRWRDRELMRVDYASLRVTRRQAEREPGEIADAVRRRLTTSAAGP